MCLLFVPVHEVLRSLQRTMTTERERLKHACEQHNLSVPTSSNYVQQLRQALSEVTAALNSVVLIV